MNGLKSIIKEISLRVAMISLVFAGLFSYLGYYGYSLLEELNKKNSEQVLESAIKMTTTNVLKNIAFTASTNGFMDYLRSTEYSRKILSKNISELLSRINWSGMDGFILFDKDGSQILKHNVSNKSRDKDFITVDLRYFGNNLSVHGDKFGSITVYLRNNYIVNTVKKYSPAIIDCNSCTPVRQLPDIPSIIKLTNSSVNLPLTVKPEMVFYSLGKLMTVIIFLFFNLVLFIVLAVSYLLKKRISEPICEEGDLSIEELKNTKHYIISQQKFAEYMARKDDILAKKLHNRIASELYPLKSVLHYSDLNKDKKDIALQALSRLHKACHEIIEGLVPENLSIIKLQGVLVDIAKTARLSLEQKNVQVIENINIDDSLLSDSISIASYEIAKESIANIIKHSEADRIEIGCSIKKYNVFELVVKDNGKGIMPLKENASSIGIVSMHELATRCGGTLNVISKLNVGTTIRFMVRLSEKKEVA